MHKQCINNHNFKVKIHKLQIFIQKPLHFCEYGGISDKYRTILDEYSSQDLKIIKLIKIIFKIKNIKDANGT